MGLTQGNDGAARTVSVSQLEPAALRQRAEALYREQAAGLVGRAQARSPEQTQQVLHELHVHQIELEMQNEELRRSQTELDEARARYFDLYDFAPVGYCTLSEEGLILEANLSAATLLGVERRALVGGAFTHHIFRADQDIYCLYRKELLASGQTQSCDLRLIDSAGSPHGVQLVASLAHDEAGASVLRVVLSDIDERMRVASELAASEARLRALFDASIDAVISMDALGQISGWSAKAETMFGWPKGEVMGLKLHETIVPLQYRSAFERGMVRFLASGESRVLNQHLELTALRRNGEEFPVGLSILSLRVGESHGFTAFVEDISERRQFQEKIRQLAFHDALTELPNRRLLGDRLTQAMEANKRRGCYGAVLFLDLDKLKGLNDVHGHDVGDLLLIETARRLTKCVRLMDTVARFGGDEFIVMIGELEPDRQASIAKVSGIAEKIRATLAEPYVLSITASNLPDQQLVHRCSASIGVVLFLANEASQNEILKRADDAMYEAKAAGGNQVRFYSPATNFSPTAAIAATPEQQDRTPGRPER